jgi:hypothetical protein
VVGRRAGTNTASNDYRTKFGLYRGIGTGYGVPTGESWIEHRTVTGYAGASNALTWKGGNNGNAWDVAATQNFLNGVTPAGLQTSSMRCSSTIARPAPTSPSDTANVSPELRARQCGAELHLAGSFGITGGTLRKDGSGTLTLATTNSYPGPDGLSAAGRCFVTGSIGNNSRRLDHRADAAAPARTAALGRTRTDRHRNQRPGRSTSTASTSRPSRSAVQGRPASAAPAPSSTAARSRPAR